MKHLRQTIRKILLEEFACASITNANIGGGIAELERLGLHIVSYYRPEEYDSGVAQTIGLHVYDDLGDQKAYWLGRTKFTGQECHGAFQCTNSDAKNLRGTGVGALLYDVACELTGEKGVSSDRDNVSPSAWKMWKYMWKSETYENVAIYDWDTEQTPNNPDDDCWGVAWEHTEENLQPEEHPLNSVFVKKDKTRPTIECLEEKGLIQYED